MQKITIDKFGPIDHVEIKISPLLVLIGEQASGKSTIAKLIYFFKSLGDEFFSRYYKSENYNIDYTNHVIFPIREKFYEMFGSTFHLPDFKIIFYYEENRTITLSLNTDKKLDVHLSEDFFNIGKDGKELKRSKKQLIKLKSKILLAKNIGEKVDYETQQTECLRNMADKINLIFGNNHNDSLYIIAGRNAMVGYSETFEKMLSIRVQQQLENRGKRAFETKEQTIDETLMLEFMNRVSVMRQSFSKNGDFEGFINQAEGKKCVDLKIAYDFVNKVVKGKYSSSIYGEKIVVDEQEERYVSLKDASSGQQESIRILQDAFYSIYSDNNVFRIIEEPEAHLYPEAQMYLIQLLAMMMNHNPKNQLIITTHSPYILTVINNLIYAHEVGEKHRQVVAGLIEEKSWINPLNVNSYMLANGNVEDIFDSELKMIKAECIDGVSSILNEQFDNLLNIENEESDKYNSKIEN